MIKNLLFDFGNVLFDLDEARTEEKLMQVLDPAKISDLFEKVLHPFERGEISEEAFFNRLQRRSKDLKDGSYYYEAWNAMLLGMPEHRFQWLMNLRKTYRVFLLSNINITHLRAVKKMIYNQTGIDDFESHYFDKVYYSFEIGLRKPELKCFEFVMSHSGILGSETLFIDDKPENVQAASDSGFHASLHDAEQAIEDKILDYLSQFQ
ncbi:MAG: HAD family phosphatase [Saprospiraceae bacterium]|nr:HAD family phosphatase [Saprospiraceae bacterium]